MSQSWETGPVGLSSAALAEPARHPLRICILFDMHCWLFGGGPKFVWELTHAMQQRGHEVSIYSSASSRHDPPYTFAPSTRIFRVSYSDRQANIARLRKTIAQENYDVAIVMQGGPMQLFWAVTLLGTGVPMVYSEHSSPERVEQLWNRPGRLAAMSGADAIHLLLPEYARSLPPWLQERVTVIPNSVPGTDAPVTKSDSGLFTLTSIGRFDTVKQIPLLVEAFGLLHGRFPQWKLDIWGYGGEEKNIARAIAQNPAKEAIRLRGITDKALDIFAQAHLFCIPSRQEGLPIAVLEAMSRGTPAVGFAQCSGVNHVVRHGTNGLLAPQMTVQSLADTLASAMDDAQRRATLGQGALETAQCYAPKPIFDRWEALLLKAAACKGCTQMDAFSEEPFASMARLSSVARREWLFRDFGQPMPGTLEAWVYYRIWKPLRSKWQHSRLKKLFYGS